jgi:hypothetical protein
VRTERHVGSDAHVGEEQRFLQQQPDAPVMCRHVDLGGRVGEHPVPQPYQSIVGTDQPGDDMQRGGLARAVGPQHRDDFPGGHRELHVESAVGRHRTQLQPAHRRLPNVRPGQPSRTHPDDHQRRHRHQEH